jgi:hypothetical protein
MAAIVKTPSRTWKAVIRKNGWPTTAKTFRTKRDAEDWARGTEDEIVRGVYIRRANAECETPPFVGRPWHSRSSPHEDVRAAQTSPAVQAESKEAHQSRMTHTFRGCVLWS